MRRFVGFWLVLVSMVLAYSPVLSHEYWIEPEDFTPPPGEETRAHLKVGSDLVGQSLTFIPLFAPEYRVIDARGAWEPSAMAGDRPALRFVPRTPGLNILALRSSRNSVNFTEWEVFETYLKTEGMAPLIERHRERGLPRTGFLEAYSRFAKALLGVGDSPEGQDRAVGFLVELVALDNPYALQAGETLRVQLLYQGRPLADTQVSVFARGEELQVMRLRTDDGGEVGFKVQPGTLYLLNAIKMIEVSGQGNLVWESFWASLTFETPAAGS